MGWGRDLSPSRTNELILPIYIPYRRRQHEDKIFPGGGALFGYYLVTRIEPYGMVRRRFLDHPACTIPTCRAAAWDLLTCRWAGGPVHGRCYHTRGGDSCGYGEAAPTNAR